jgi:hypothetical protein
LITNHYLKRDDTMTDTNKTSVTLTTQQWPTGRMLWEVEFPELPPEQLILSAKLQLLYNNAAYDLSAAVMAKLGLMYSELITEILDSAVDNDRAIEGAQVSVRQLLDKVSS